VTKSASAAEGSSLLSYQMITHFPTKVGNTRVMVDRSGAVKVHRNDAEPSEGEQWNRPFPAEPMSVVKDPETRLATVLQRGGFFSMPARLVDELTTDGTLQTLSWNGRGGPRTVTVDRARSPQFDALLAEVFRVLGVGPLV